jgi:chemotaxis protein histidine kinase CheA
MDDSLTIAFVGQAERNLAHVAALLHEMDGSRGKTQLPAIESCYRYLHTISGLARHLQINRISSISQRAEQVLEEMRTNPWHYHGTKITLLKRAIQRLSELVESLGHKHETQAEITTEKTDANKPPVHQVVAEKSAAEKTHDEQLMQELRAWSSFSCRAAVKSAKRPDNQTAPAYYWRCNQSTTGPPLAETMNGMAIYDR